MTAALLAGIGVFELFRMKGLAVLSFEGVLSILGAVILVLPKDPWFAFLPANTDKSAFVLSDCLVVARDRCRFQKYVHH